MNHDNSELITTDKPEEPETLEQKRNNVIEKINNIVELGIYIKKKKVDLDELNDKDFDILIYAIEHSNSVHLVQYILNETHYKTLNYAFYDTGKYKSFLVSVIDKHINYEGYKIPLFTAIALNKFKIADLLLKKNANINYLINGRGYHDIDIINYLYYMSGYSDFLNRRNLKYILNNGFHIKHINTEVVHKMLKRDFNEGLLEILLKNYVFDNNFIIKLLVISHFQETVSNKELQQMIDNEKNKIIIDDSVYDICDERENYDAVTMILDYDSSGKESINDRIEDYELLEKGVGYDNYKLVQKILNHPYLDEERLHMEDALIEASKNIQLDILELLLNRIRESSHFDWKTLNYESILGETSRYHSMYYVEERRLKHIKVMQMLIEPLLNYSFEQDPQVENSTINIGLLKTLNPSYINLIINIIIKIDHLSLIKYLLENEELKSHIDINAKDRNGECPLLTAYHSDNMILFKYILDYGANSQIITKEGKPLLSLAIKNKNYKAIKYLLQQNILFNGENDGNAYPLFIQMILQNKVEVVRAVFENEDNLNSEIEVEEENGVMKKYNIDELISDKNNHDYYPNYGFTYLILAYLLQHYDIFKILLQHSDINELDANGFNILHYAILKEDLATLSLLLSLGVEINYYEDIPKNLRGNSALDISIAIQSHEIFKILLNHPLTQFNLPNWRSEISIVTLIKLSHFSPDLKLNIMKQLVERGADVNYVDSSRNSPLIYAIQEKLIPIAEYLMVQGAEVNFINDYGYTPLAFAIRKGYLPMVKILVEHGADINFQIEGKNESKIQTLFMFSVSQGEVAISKYLIDCGVEIHFNQIQPFYEFMKAINNNGKKEIFEYIAHKRINEFTSVLISEIISWHLLDLIKILIENHLEVNLRDEQGNIPLTYAVIYNERIIVNYLIEHGANIFNVDCNGKTIYELCRECYDLNNNNSISIHNKIKRLIEFHKF